MMQKENQLRGAMRVELRANAKTALPDSIKAAYCYNLYLIRLFEDGEALLVARGVVEENSTERRFSPVQEIFSCRLEDIRPIPEDVGALINAEYAD